MSSIIRASQRRRHTVAVLALVSMLLPALARAQQPPPSLGELARIEAERRKAMRTPGKVYTKEDLPKTAPPVPAPAPAAGQKPADPAAPEAAKPAAEKPKPGEEKTEEWWRARMAAARDALRRSELFAESLQSRINALTNDFENRGDPSQRARVGEDRQKALAELARVTDEKQALKKQIADIEEEARQAGVPPGWIR